MLLSKTRDDVSQPVYSHTVQGKQSREQNTEDEDQETIKRLSTIPGRADPRRQTRRGVDGCSKPHGKASDDLEKGGEQPS
jgi:hypothetical protein